MNRARFWPTVITCLALFCGNACGGDDDDDAPGTVSTGLPADSRLSDLSDAQLEQVCETFLVAIDEGLAGQSVQLSCTFSSIGAATGVSISGQVRFDVAMCEQLVDECVASKAEADAGPPSSTTGNVDCAAPAATAPQRSCDATVRQYERCYSAIADDFDNVAVTFDCARADAALRAQEAMMPVSPKMVPPPECAELMQLCPQISLPGTRPVEP